jgi:hypothetical protein
VKPKVPFEVAKWIFAITIIISYVFLIYRGIRAIRVMRSGSVTECYLEPLAAIWQSMRLTKSGQGWRRFLVFAELTKSKKGANYIALFVYFQFKGALIIIVAQGPRIAINAMTLYAVMQAQIIPGGDHASEDRSGFEQFFMNIKTMVETGNKQETVIYFTMLFSLVIWVIGALGVIFAALFYILFLWHYIPRADNGLTNYCRRKLETRLARIVGKKMKKAIEKEDQKRKEEERRAIKKGKPDTIRSKPTLPTLGDDDKASDFGLRRSETFSTVDTLPQYTSNVPSRTNTVITNSTFTSAGRKPVLPTLDERPMPDRADTQFSTASYGSNAPLLSQAGGIPTSSPMPPLPPLDYNADYFDGQPHMGPPARTFTPVSQPRAGPRPLLPQVDTYSNRRYSQESVSPVYSSHTNPPFAEFAPYDNRGPAPGPLYELSPVDNTPTDATSVNNMPGHYYSNSNGSDTYRPPQMPAVLRTGSPAMPQMSNGPPRAGTVPPRAGTAPPRPGIPAGLQSAIQRREASQPMPNRAMNGSAPPQMYSAPVQQPSWGPSPVQRSYTPADRSVTPADRSFTPAQRSFTPADRSFTPAQRSYTPAERSFTPADRSFTPAQRSFTPADRSMTPADRSFTPAQRSFTPADRSFTPADRSFTPAQRSYTPADRGYPPSNQRGYDNGYN